MSAIHPASTLPLTHPSYRYPVSLNPYATKIDQAVSHHVLQDRATESYAGQWRALLSLPESAPLTVELGCNGGHVVLEWAARNPHRGYLGIDWKFKQVFRAFEKARKREIPNVAFLRAHGVRIPYIFAPQEIDELCFFFPDPWPKKAHLKNRLITADWLRAIAPLLKPNGMVHIKSDHTSSFEWILEQIQLAQDIWQIVEKSDDLHAENPRAQALEIPDVTLFEKLYIKDAIPIRSVRLARS